MKNDEMLAMTALSLFLNDTKMFKRRNPIITRASGMAPELIVEFSF